MHIAFISDHASPLGALGGVDGGGQNVYVAELARVLSVLGHHVDVFTRWSNPSEPQLTSLLPGVRVVNLKAGPIQAIPKEKLLPHMEEFTRSMLKWIKSNRVHYDLVHAHFFMSALVAGKVRENLGIPYVVTFHALGKVRRLYQGSSDSFPETRLLIEEEAVKAAARIIAECPQDKTDLLAHYGADPARLVVIPAGVNTEEFSPVDRSVALIKANLDPRFTYLLQLGRMVPRKGVETVIRGFSQYRERYGNNLKLVVVGGETQTPDPQQSPEIGRLQRIADNLGLGKDVIFTGNRPRDLLKYYYSAAQVFATLPWYEPFGMTALEAMACGTPVIGSSVGGLKYTVKPGRTGLLVPERNPSAFAKALRDLLASPSLTQMKKACRRRVVRYFSWEKIALQMEAVYLEIVSSHLLSAPAFLSGSVRRVQ